MYLKEPIDYLTTPKAHETTTYQPHRQMAFHNTRQPQTHPQTIPQGNKRSTINYIQPTVQFLREHWFLDPCVCVCQVFGVISAELDECKGIQLVYT